MVYFARFFLLLALAATGWAHAQMPLGTERPLLTGIGSSEVEAGAISAVGPGDTLNLTVFGRPELSVQVTVDTNGQIAVPFLGNVTVNGQSPSSIGRELAESLKQKGYLRDPQVSIEVVKVRSRIVSVLGQIEKPGRYPIESHLTVLELLALAGGLKSGADDNALLLRRDEASPDHQKRIDIAVGSRQFPTRQVQDLPLQAGDILYVPQAQRFFVYGEVARAGAYPMEEGLDVMRALALAGGLTQRASERRIEINRKDANTGETLREKVKLTDMVRAGDVIRVDERLF